MRKRFYLLVEIGEEARKLPFARSATREVVEAFVDHIRPSAGYPVRIALGE